MKKNNDLTMMIIDNFVGLKKAISRVRKRIEQQNIIYPTFKPATIVREKSTEEIDELINMIDEFQEEFTRNNQDKTIEDFHSISYRLFCRLLARTLHKLTIYFTAYDGTPAGSDSLFDGAKRVLNERRCFYDQLCLAHYSLPEKNDLLEYELELEQREHKFHSTSLLALKNKYSTVLTAYLNQCIDFHKHFHAIDACEIVSLLDPIIIDKQQRDQLIRALKRLRIPLTFPNLQLHLNVNNVSEQSSNQNSFASFIPSKAIEERRSRTLDVYVDAIIRDHRWLVLLGSPGSGKTTLARWLTHTFARAVLQDLEQVSIGEEEQKKHLGITRLPILIRVSEFTYWLQNNPTLTLFDYIGQHTWYDQLYLKDKSDMIQDFVRHHHALIILIGLDEVTTFELRTQVLTLIHDFIDSFVLSSEFISAYDDIKLAKMWPTQEDRWEGLQNGNVIIITSRIAGYDVQPLQSELITHHAIVPMRPLDISDFVTTWRVNVQTEVLRLLSTITSELDNNQSAKVEDWFSVNKLLEIINSKKEITAWASNRRLLSVLCTLYARQGDQTFENTRFYLYEQIVKLVLQQSRIETHMLKFVLSRLALCIQLRSMSGLIDDFDLKTLCRFLLKEWNDQNAHEHCSLTPSQLRYRTEELIQLLNKDTGMITTPYLSVYGFFHSSFQEYFASIAMITTNSLPEELAVRFCSYYSQPQVRSSLLLAMSNISSAWDSIPYNQFCEYLISYDSLCNKYVPLGALLLVASFPDLACLPSRSIVFKALDTLLLVDDDGPETCLFQSPLSHALDALPVPMVQQWFKQVLLRNVVSRLKIMSIIWNEMNKRETHPEWINISFLKFLWSYYNRFEEKVDVYIQKCFNMMISIRRPEHMFQDLRSYLSDKLDLIVNLDPKILAAIIVLYGGLQRTENRKKQQISVTFSPQFMHRDSPLSSVFIDCFNNTADQTSRIQFLIDQCDQIVLAAVSSDVSLRVVHSFIVLLCLNGISQPSNYCQYKNYNALQLAIRHLKLIRIYLHDSYIDMKLVDAIDVTTIVKKIIHDNEFIVVHSLAHAFGLLICNKYCPHRILPSHRIDRARLVNVKLPISFDHRRFLDYNEAMCLTILSFIYCIPPRMCAHFDDIEDLEKNDIELLKHGQHPFQLLQDHPTLLLIAYLPKHVQTLYTHLIKNNTSLLFVHLLIEFLTQIQYMELYSLRLWILLTVLEPILIEYKMMNFLRTTINRTVHTITNECEEYLFNTIIKQSYVESLVKRLLLSKNSENQFYSTDADVEEERIRLLSTAQDDNNSNDLRIYTASINFAHMTDDEMSSAEAWLAVTNIKDSLWRLDAFIVLSRINAFLQKKLRNEDHLLNEFNEILERTEPLISFLIFIAIFVRYLPYLEQISSTEKDQLIFKIFDRMRTISTLEQQIICQALAHFSSFRPLICQFIRQSNWANDSDALIDVFEINSVRFTDVFRSSSSFGNNTAVLISSMYLNELAFDVHLLQNWFDSDFGKDFVSNSIMSLTSFEEFLLELNKQIEVSDESRLSSMVVEKINTFLSSSLSEVDESQLLTLNLLLRHFNELEDKSASVSIIKWLTWHSDSNLKPFAYHSAILLAQYGLWTFPVLDICCELLTSNDDFYRRKARTVIRTYPSLDSHIIQWVKKWNTYSTEIISQVKECLRYSFSLNQSNEIDSIIHEERNRFNILYANNSRSFFISYRQISIFELIAEMTTEVTEHLNKIIQQLSSSNDSIDYRFFLWIINHSFSNPFILKQIGNYVDCLLKLMQYDHDKDIQIAAIQALVWCQKNDYVSILWDIIRNNSSNIDESVLIACFWLLYYGRDKPIEEQELNDLHLMRVNSPSETIRKASLLGLYRQILHNPIAYSVHEIYSSHIIDTTYYLFNYDVTQDRNDMPLKTAAQWIIEHASELLTTFVQDTFESMCNNEMRVFDARFTYIAVADFVCDEISDKFTQTVCQSSFGEQSFKEALYKTNKKLNRYRQRYICLNLYSRFEEITDQYVSMLMELALLEDNIEAKSDDSILRSIIPKMQTLHDREVVEELLSAMQSTSLCQRFYAAKVLYRLVITDKLSVVEFQQSLIGAIENPWSHQKSLHRFSKGRLEYELKLILRRLLFSKDPNKQQIQLPTLNIFDKSISLTFPTLIFSTNSNV